jgi:hypothetical protein
MNDYIILGWWIIYCSLEGIYDSWVYFSMNEAIKRVRVFPFGPTFHVPHAIAFLQRMSIGLVLGYCMNDYRINIDLGLIIFSLGLMLPLLQTGFYLSGRTFLARKMKTSPPRDANNKQYHFFSYTHKSSSWFPDYSPITRGIMFTVGLVLTILNHYGYL